MGKSQFQPVDQVIKQVQDAAEKILENGDPYGKVVTCGAPLTRQEETPLFILEPHTAEGHRERQKEKWDDLRKEIKPVHTDTAPKRSDIDWHNYCRTILKPAISNIIGRLPPMPQNLDWFIRARHKKPVLLIFIPEDIYDEPESLCLMSLIHAAFFPRIRILRTEVWPDTTEYREKLGTPTFSHSNR